MDWDTVNRSIIALTGGSTRKYDQLRRRESRLREKQQKQEIKQAQMELASLEVELFDLKIESLSGIGRNCGKEINWGLESRTLDPRKPIRSKQNEIAAQRQLDTYSPSLIDRLSGKAKKMREALSKAVDQAKKHDDRAFENALKRHEKNLATEQKRREIALGILEQDVEFYKQAIKEFADFENLDEVGRHLSFQFEGSKICSLEIDLFGPEIVPKEKLSLTSTGKLSRRSMPIGQKIDIYQDYVCGSLFRMARELKALLPLKFVVCSGFAEVLNSSTGTSERQCLCSAGFSVQDFDSINFSKADFSDAMVLFRHEMKHSKRKGFSPVKSLQLEDFDLSWLD